MLSKKSFCSLFMFVAVLSSTISFTTESQAVEASQVSPVMQCIGRCVKALGWEEVEWCADMF